ncbi:MAG: hypothetical protein JRJ00_00265 [Deltaproteobacteria bacterium]|nr:hypothetical protein [Deltaproteobacteria bacterium]
MNVILKEGFTYTPKWNGNKKREKEDQITVEFEFLAGSDFSLALDEENKFNYLKNWLLSCKKVNNLSVNDSAVTPEGIFSIKGLAELFSECRNAYDKETAVCKKK